MDNSDDDDEDGEEEELVSRRTSARRGITDEEDELVSSPTSARTAKRGSDGSSDKEEDDDCIFGTLAKIGALRKKMKHVQQVGVVRSMHSVSEWLRLMETPSDFNGFRKDTVSTEKFESLCRVTQWVHDDFLEVKGRFGAVCEIFERVIARMRTQEKVTEELRNRLDAVEQKNGELNDRVDQQQETVEALTAQTEETCDQLRRRMRDQTNRLENAAHRVERAVEEMDALQQKVTSTDGLKEDMEIVARKVAELDAEAQATRSARRVQDETIAAVREAMESGGMSRRSMRSSIYPVARSDSRNSTRDISQPSTPMRRTRSKRQAYMSLPGSAGSRYSSQEGQTLTLPVPTPPPPGTPPRVPDPPPEAPQPMDAAGPVLRAKFRVPADEAYEDDDDPAPGDDSPRRARVAPAAVGFEDEHMEEIQGKIEAMESLTKQLVTGQNQLNKRIGQLQMAEGEVQRLQESMKEVLERVDFTEKSIGEQIAQVKKAYPIDEEAKEFTNDFNDKWSLFRERNYIKMGFLSWCLYVIQNRKLREALRITKDSYVRSHASSRLRTWWYATHKDINEERCRKLGDITTSQALQIDVMQSALVRHEKAAAEQTRVFQNRMGSLEKALETQSVKKADQASVQEMVDSLTRRLDTEYDLRPFRAADEQLFQAVEHLKKEKMDAEQGERNKKRLLDLIAELRVNLAEHSRALEETASCAALDAKAEASVVEEITLLLARQADQLSGAVFGDLERIRLALTRFLELSPDVRKAALSLGLNPNERCVMCGPNAKKLPDLVTGSDFKTYSVGPQDLNSASAQAARVVQFHLGARLASTPTPLGKDCGTGACVVPMSPASTVFPESPTPRALSRAEMVSTPATTLRAETPMDFAARSAAGSPGAGELHQGVATSLQHLRRLVDSAPGWAARSAAPPPTPTGVGMSHESAVCHRQTTDEDQANQGGGRSSRAARPSSSRTRGSNSSAGSGGSPSGPRQLTAAGAPQVRRNSRGSSPGPCSAFGSSVNRPRSARQYFPAVAASGASASAAGGDNGASVAVRRRPSGAGAVHQ
eukprot:TRINITY_DN6447_c0_g1_i1.p1 TRINITY_DN6447_c0_g1~~TRINITY_DN6447_c0_g1_i1.p1  ORF type:complete len:1050 (+),score=220.50 TRINITY_DN6447_c0_g1_i1:133-3282(+)